MDINETIKMAWSALTANKLRSGLTMLGIAIGNASVIAMVAIGQGAQRLAAEQFESLGPNVLFVTMTSARVRRALSARAKPLLWDDAIAIARSVPSISEIAPEYQSEQLLSYQANNFSNSIIGTTPEFLSVRNYQMAQGRFLTDADLSHNGRVIVLGAEIAQRLLGKADPIGQIVKIRNISFEVVGVLKPKGVLFGTNQDNRAIIPLTTQAKLVIGRSSPYGVMLNTISVKAPDPLALKSAGFQITNLMRLRHPEAGEDDIRIYPQNSIIEIATETNDGLSRMLAAIASVSLLVGGIGVMNIMLVSVTERTEEIGLRKALGAKEKDILGQFLVEAVLLAAMGGVIGVTVGIGGTLFASAISPLATSISPLSVGVAIAVSGSIGLIFGVVPAQRAAQLDPIIALRRI
jgi:putative ABC transport system permease protein